MTHLEQLTELISIAETYQPVEGCALHTAIQQAKTMVEHVEKEFAGLEPDVSTAEDTLEQFARLILKHEWQELAEQNWFRRLRMSSQMCNYKDKRLWFQSELEQSQAEIDRLREITERLKG